jgi:hypothetical protein
LFDYERRGLFIPSSRCGGDGDRLDDPLETHAGSHACFSDGARSVRGEDVEDDLVAETSIACR